jgi:uncharacterized membrane protein
MLDFLQRTSTQQAIAFCVVCFGLGLLAFFFLRRLRGSTEEDQVSTSDMLTKFREMHAQGVLSDEEYRTIKTNLSARLQSEIKDNETAG